MAFCIRAPDFLLSAAVLLAICGVGCGKPAPVVDPATFADFYRDPADAARLQPWKAVPDVGEIPPDWIIRRDDSYDSIGALITLPTGGEWSLEVESGARFGPGFPRKEGLHWGLNSSIEPRYKAFRRTSGELWIHCDLAQLGLPDSWSADGYLIRRHATETDEQLLQEILPRRSALFRRILAMKSE